MGRGQIFLLKLKNKQQRKKSTGAAAGYFSVGDDDMVLESFCFCALILM